MKRLIDEANEDSPGNGFAQLSGEQRLAVLVQSAEKFQPNPFRRRWVLAQIRSGGRKQGLRLRPWVVAVAGLLVVGSATAGGTAWWRSYHPVISAPRATAIDQPPVVRAEPAPFAEIPAAPLSAPAPEIAPSPAPRAAVASETPKGEDPTTVVQAIRALRKEHDPARAESLLQGYLHSHPRGALTEDALALLIETAAARHDPVAAERATRYLRLYPNGRYRVAAERAIGSRPGQ
jgi:hypothetical protein